MGVILLSEGLLDVSVGQSVEQQVGCHFLVLVAGDVCLSSLDLAETQTSQLNQPTLTLLIAYSSCCVTTIWPSWFSTSSSPS